MNKLLTFIFFISLSVAQFYSQENKVKIDFDKLDAYYQKTLEEWEIPGMSIGIVKDGKIIFSEGACC